MVVVAALSAALLVPATSSIAATKKVHQSFPLSMMVTMPGTVRCIWRVHPVIAHFEQAARCQSGEALMRDVVLPANHTGRVRRYSFQLLERTAGKRPHQTVLSESVSQLPLPGRPIQRHEVRHQKKKHEARHQGTVRRKTHRQAVLPVTTTTTQPPSAPAPVTTTTTTTSTTTTTTQPPPSWYMTSVALSASPVGAIGAPVTLTATVTPVVSGVPPPASPTGTVTFNQPWTDSSGNTYYDSPILGCSDVPINPTTGAATCTTTPYTTSQSYAAAYAGDYNSTPRFLYDQSQPFAVHATAAAPTPIDVATPNAVLSLGGATSQTGQLFEFAVTTVGLDNTAEGCSMTTPTGLPTWLGSTSGSGYLVLQGTPPAGSEGQDIVSTTVTCTGYAPETASVTITVATSPTFPYYLDWNPAPLILPTETVPAAVSYASLVPSTSWAYLGNDVLGDCTVAAELHLEQLFYAEQGVTWNPTTADAMALYNIAVPDGQTGGDIGTSVQGDIYFWNQIHMGGIYVENTAPLANPTNEAALTEALQLTGGLLATIWFNINGTLTGHEVMVDGASSAGVEIVTWGQQQTVTWSQWDTPGYLSEVDAVLPSNWDGIGHGPGGIAPSMVDTMFPGQMLTQTGTQSGT